MCTRQSIVHLAKTAGGLANYPLAASGREEGRNPKKIEATHPSKRAIQIFSLLHHFNRCFQLHLKRLSRDKAHSVRNKTSLASRAQQLPPVCNTPSLCWLCMNSARPGEARMSGAVSGIETSRAPWGYKFQARPAERRSGSIST